MLPAFQDIARDVADLCTRYAVEMPAALREANATREALAGEEIAIAPPSEEGLTALLRARLAHAPQARARNIQRLAGFNSKEIFWVDIEDCADWPVRSIIRREP